jgi:hypothetical protein
MFDTTKEDLKDILRKVHEGSLQLPDFQRDYVWGDEDVRSLIASIAKGFPVGALLTLETGGSVRFKPRLLEGVEPSSNPPKELLLDGQQRMTSLYQSMFSQRPLRTRTLRSTEVERFYYIDIRKALDSGSAMEDAIVGVPGDKIIRSNFGKNIDLDVSTQQQEFQQHLFPVNLIFNNRKWFRAWQDYWRKHVSSPEDPDLLQDLESRFYDTIIERVERYEMPIIRLSRENSREAICLVFEKVNVGGKKLDAFELVTAIYAADTFDLREDWTGSARPAKPGRQARMVQSGGVRYDVLKEVASTDFLQACTLLHTREVRLERQATGLKDKELPQVSCRRDALLALPLSAYQKHADSLEQGFRDAARFLAELKIIRTRDVPYPPQVVALASTFAILGQGDPSAVVKDKLEHWFWAVTFGELYGSSTETRMARDVPSLIDWIAGSDNRPRSIDEAIFQEERLRSLRSRQSAAYKGLHALLMKRGCKDFVTKRTAEVMTFVNDQIDVHHIFPKQWCEKHRIPPAIYNSIVNKTPLSASTNREIGGRAPSEYLGRIEHKHGIPRTALDEILATHLIDPVLLRNDDFDSFFAARLSALSGVIEEAMKKPVVREAGSAETEHELLEFEDDPDELLEEIA